MPLSEISGNNSTSTIDQQSGLIIDITRTSDQMKENGLESVPMPDNIRVI